MFNCTDKIIPQKPYPKLSASFNNLKHLAHFFFILAIYLTAKILLDGIQKRELCNDFRKEKGYI